MPSLPVHHNSFISPAIYDPDSGAAQVDNASVYRPGASIRSLAPTIGTFTILSGAGAAALRNPETLATAIRGGAVVLEAAALVTPVGWVAIGTIAIVGAGIYYVYERKSAISDQSEPEPAILPGRSAEGPNLPSLPGSPDQPPKLAPLPGFPAKPPKLPKLTGAPPVARKPEIETYPAQPPKLPNVWQAESGKGKKPARGKKTSQIDRVAFGRYRRTRWKMEARENPSGYNAGDLVRMKKGNPPIGSDGFPVEFHHVEQIPEGPIDAMTRTDHRLGENYKRNHPKK